MAATEVAGARRIDKGRIMKRPVATVIGILVAGLLALSPAAAESRFSERGRIDGVDLKGGFLVIDDSQFRLTSTTRVYTPTGLLGAPQQIRKGMTIRFTRVRPAGPGKPVISEIWIAPGN